MCCNSKFICVIYTSKNESATIVGDQYLLLWFTAVLLSDHEVVKFVFPVELDAYNSQVSSAVSGSKRQFIDFVIDEIL